MTNLDAFQNLNEMILQIHIINYQTLISLTGLQNIKVVDHITVSSNPLLTNLSGFERVTNIEGLIIIENNEKLLNLGIEHPYGSFSFTTCLAKPKSFRFLCLNGFMCFGQSCSF